MLMNKLEFLLMNNPIRAFIQDTVEAETFRKLSPLKKGKIILEIGCGNGDGAKLIWKYFSPKQIYGIDLDPKMIALANENNNNNKIMFQQGSATKLPFKKNQFDAIFDFGIIHHIPDWKNCIKEMKRVLKPNGIVHIEDYYKETFQSPFGRLLKKILIHPYEDMHSKKEFVEYLKKSGFKILSYEEHFPLKTTEYFVIIAKK